MYSNVFIPIMLISQRMFYLRETCLEFDDFSWKISGQIPAVNMRLSDMRLFKIIKHLQSLSFPRSTTTVENQIESWTIDTTQQTLETIETMTPMKKILQKIA